MPSRRLDLNMSDADLLTFYSSPGPMTDPLERAPLFEGLPDTVQGLVSVVQGLLIHIFWAKRYGLELSDERKEEVQIRDVAAKLACLTRIDDAPLSEPRPLETRLVGNCRDFAVFLCALLRYRGIPARARCGFGTYFLPDHFEDHWVVEYWDSDSGRWVMVDAQLDAFQRESLGISFDPLDMPPGQFVNGGEAWRMCRSGEADPDSFGIFDMHGLWFVRGNLLRDFLSFNKVEILPWDGGWGYLTGEGDPVSDVMDRISGMISQGDAAFADIRRTYTADAGFHPPIDYYPAAYR